MKKMLSIIVVSAVLFDSCLFQATDLKNVSLRKKTFSTCTVLKENTGESQKLFLELENKLETDYRLIIQDLEKGMQSNPYQIALQLNLPLQSYVYYLFKRKNPAAPIGEFAEFLKVNPSAFPDFSVEAFENYLPYNQPSMSFVEKVRLITGSACKEAIKGSLLGLPAAFAGAGYVNSGLPSTTSGALVVGTAGVVGGAGIGAVKGLYKGYRKLPEDKNSYWYRFKNYIKTKWNGSSKRVKNNKIRRQKFAKIVNVKQP